MAGHARSRFWNLEARGREAAWVGGSCPDRRSLCRGDVLYTTERQIASSPTRKPLARSPFLPFYLLPSSFLFILPPPFFFSLFLSLSLFPCPFTRLHSFSLSLSFFLSLFLSRCIGPSSRSSHCSLSTRCCVCSFFLGPFILLGPPFRLFLIRSFLRARACAAALSSRRESLRPRPTAYSYLAVLRRGSGYARRLRQRCRAVRSTKNSSATSRVAAIGRFGWSLACSVGCSVRQCRRVYHPMCNTAFVIMFIVYRVFFFATDLRS